MTRQWMLPALRIRPTTQEASSTLPFLWAAAARKGCRTGIIYQYGNTDITNDVINVMRDNGFDVTLFNPPTIGTITITVTAPDGTTLDDALDAPPGSVVSVQLSIPVSSVQWVSSYFLPSTNFESDVIVMMKQ